MPRRLYLPIIVALYVLSAAGAFAQQTQVPQNKPLQLPECSSCDYVPCIRESITQKEALVQVYRRLAEEFGKYYLKTDDTGRRVPADTVPRDDADTADTADYKARFDEYSAKAEKETEAIAAPPSCHYPKGLSLSTHSITCSLDVKPVLIFRMSVPCRAIYELALMHESIHMTACRDRRHSELHDLDLLPTPYGLAMEETAAYDMEIIKLESLLNSLTQPNGRRKKILCPEVHPVISPK
jgi:hypothetical protein